ncbi:hypothetical protein PIB30_033759 [Stylosanthes scabra]|uniref:PB1-like domain-containing protein n=1 Tax=Stylosanthes scabra TaxID=79078 RepID=A0ABU6SCP4_9FABA|nr:hypothetical protein [Stylosanthes scabra]
MASHPMTFVFHYGGNLVNDRGGALIYEPDNTEVLTGVEEDTLDVFFVKNYYKKLKYDKAKTCLWKVLGISLELGLRKLEFDPDLFEMVRDCRRNNNIINIYFDHGVSKPHLVNCMSEEDDVVVLSKSTSQPNKSNATCHPMKSTTHPTRSSSQPTKSNATSQSKGQPNVQPKSKPTVQPKSQPTMQTKIQKPTS